MVMSVVRPHGDESHEIHLPQGILQPANMAQGAPAESYLYPVG